MKIYVILIFLLLAAISLMSFVSCKNAPPKVEEPVMVEPSPTPIEPIKVGPIELPGFKLEWSKASIEMLKKQMANLNKGQKDMKRFCPKYEELNIDEQAIVWGHLLSAMVKFESGYNPKSKMTESDGSISQGLLQLTYGNSFCPRNKAEADLDDPIVNLGCGIKLMGSFVAKDGVIAAGGYVSRGAPPAKGLARYWAVLRVPDSKRKHKLAEIMALTSKAPGCK